MKPDTCPRCEDFADDARKVLSKRCTPDERHCSCVPHLRAEVARLTADNTILNNANISLLERVEKAEGEIAFACRLVSMGTAARDKAQARLAENLVTIDAVTKERDEAQANYQWAVQAGRDAVDATALFAQSQVKEAHKERAHLLDLLQLVALHL